VISLGLCNGKSASLKLGTKINFLSLRAKLMAMVNAVELERICGVLIAPLARSEEGCRIGIICTIV
jgi:hypothetical protein